MDAPPVQYVKTSDGYDIAYAENGSGQPVVFLPIGITHLQLVRPHDRRIAPWLDEIAKYFRLIQYDDRGQGMSSRQLPPNHSMEDYERDLEAVADRLDLQQFALIGYFYSAHVAVRYALRHPERVRALVLISCSLSMKKWGPLDSIIGIAERNWDAFLHGWVPASFMPDERQEFVDYSKRARSQEDWVASARVFMASDITQEVRDLRIPTLVLHPRDYIWLPAEESMKVAANIAGARFVLLDGLLPLGNPDQSVAAIRSFLAGLGSEAARSRLDPPAMDLSSREVEVLRLIAAGRSNQQIADELVISLNTVRRHVSNVFDKTGVTNRVEAASYARDHGIT